MPNSSRSSRLGARTFLVTLAIFATAANAEPPKDILKVEEDWMVILNVPGEDVDSPQFHTIMSPYPNLDNMHFQVNWNYREYPDFAAGGLEVLSWDGESLRRSQTMRTQQLSTSAETLTWTQSLVTNGNLISFQITNGQSTTWGTFGGMTLDRAHPLTNLDTYAADTSVANSMVTYGCNRVDLIMIVEVRKYNEEGLLERDTTPRVVFQLEDDGEGDGD